MSCHAWMGCTVTVYGHEHDEAAREWCKAASVSRDAGGNTTLFFEWDCAGWFDDALEMLRNDLSTLPLPVEAWSAEARYEFYDEPTQDGCFTEFSIIDGKLTGCKESRIVMVDVEPWYEFDLTKGE